VVGDMDGDCKLFEWYWVFSAVCFHLQGKCGVVGHGAGAMQWVVIPSQFDGLANGTECGLDTTSLDLLSSSKFAFLDPSSKNVQDQQSFCWHQVLKVQIDFGWKKLGPVPPVTLPCCKSCHHDPRVDVGVDSVESTHPIKVFGRPQQLQKLFCGSGKQ